MVAREKPNYTELVHQVVKSAPEPLTFAEIFAEVDRRQPIVTRNPKGTIRNVLGQSSLLVSLGDGRYGYLPHLLRDNVLRLPLTADEPALQPLRYTDELRQALWPSFFEVQKRSDRSPRRLRLPTGDEVELPLEFFGRGVWGSAPPEELRRWLEREHAERGDALVVRVVDAGAARYEATLERRRERNEAAVAQRNQELADAAYQLLRRAAGREMPSSYLIVDLMARGLYRNPVPPDPLEAVLTADPRFVDAGFSSFMLAEDLTPEMESTIRRRKEALPELFGPVEPSAEIPDSDGDESPAMPARESLERMMADIMEVVSQQQFGSIEEANAFLQDLLAKGGPPRRRAETPLQRAQDLMYDAREATGARRVKLARQALQISPDCADAYVLLAEETARTPSEALNIYAQGVAAGERALGPRAFKEDVGHFWGILETRPYMRARLGLAECLWSVGRREEAIAHYWEMLRLNPGDNQGVRYLLVSILLEEGRDADLKKLFRQYREDASAAWLYGRALHAFRTQGANPAAKKLLATARWSNPHVPAYLVGKKRIPRQLPEYMGLGDESEAIHCAVQQRRAWQRTPGALDWLQGQSR